MGPAALRQDVVERGLARARHRAALEGRALRRPRRRGAVLLHLRHDGSHAGAGARAGADPQRLRLLRLQPAAGRWRHRPGGDLLDREVLGIFGSERDDDGGRHRGVECPGPRRPPDHRRGRPGLGCHRSAPRHARGRLGGGAVGRGDRRPLRAGHRHRPWRPAAGARSRPARAARAPRARRQHRARPDGPAGADRRDRPHRVAADVARHARLLRPLLRPLPAVHADDGHRAALRPALRGLCDRAAAHGGRRDAGRPRRHRDRHGGRARRLGRRPCVGDGRGRQNPHHQAHQTAINRLDISPTPSPTIPPECTRDLVVSPRASPRRPDRPDADI